MMLHFLLILMALLPGSFHDPATPVLIDTDAAPDDLRALNLLLSMENIEIIGITCSDGATAPQIGVQKVQALLRDLSITGIPVAAGRELQLAPPPWREFCEQFAWGPGELDGDSAVAAKELIRDALASSDQLVTVVCLGPLTNLADVLTEFPDSRRHIERVLWYHTGVRRGDGNGNDRDWDSAEKVMNASLRLLVFSNPDTGTLAFDEDMFNRIRDIDTACARSIATAHGNEQAMRRIMEKHFGIWDELPALWFIQPDLFRYTTEAGRQHISVCTPVEPSAAREVYIRTLADAAGPATNTMLRRFPVDPDDFRRDLRPYVEEIISRHGLEEWRIAVLTSELHSHLGIYSIVGAKMGLRAREYIGCKHGELEVVSLAGLTPPLSCLNDGLQVSTGATVGHGSISVPDEPLGPQAIFIKGERKLSLRLKDELIKTIRNDISGAIEQYGNLTPAYWQRVREIGIRYWLEWDRAEIFDIREIE